MASSRPPPRYVFVLMRPTGEGAWQLEGVFATHSAAIRYLDEHRPPKGTNMLLQECEVQE